MALTDNIVSYWNLDESSGNAADSAGSNTLTNTGSAAYASAKINNGVDFGSSNTSKYLKISSALGIDGGAFSWSGWVKVTTAPDSGVPFNAIFAQENNTSDVGYSLYYKNNAGTLQVIFQRARFGIGGEVVTVSQTLTIGTWYHLVCTYDGSNLNLYLNGSLLGGPTAATGNGSSAVTGDYYSMGRAFQDSQLEWWFSGMEDEVGIWSRALTATEVATLYNSGSGLQYPFASSATVMPRKALLGVGR